MESKTETEVRQDLEQKLSFSDRYKTFEKIGKGGQGKVYKVEEVATGNVYAAKIISLNDWTEISELEKEERALRILDHENIVGYEGYFVQKDLRGDPEFILVTEYIEGRDLSSLLNTGKKFTEEELLRIREQALAGLKYAHLAGVVHKDIKPANILLDKEGKVKITDFGVAKFLEESLQSTGLNATLYYISPEELKGEIITQSTDYYKLGLTLLDLALGERLNPNVTFRQNKPKDDIQRLRSQEKYSSAFLDSLERLVDEDPERRMSTQLIQKITLEDDPVIANLTTFFGGLAGAVSGGVTVAPIAVELVNSDFFFQKMAGIALFGFGIFGGGFAGSKLYKLINYLLRPKSRKQQLTQRLQDAYLGALDNSDLNPERKTLPMPNYEDKPKIKYLGKMNNPYIKTIESNIKNYIIFKD